ncbi:MAG: kynureninase [Bacteroidetes bacterium]|nr:MAG: kynureninase [Bacteroidota bacterium]
MEFYERAYASYQDETDELNHFRERFVMSDPGLIYLDGNSLGMLPGATTEKLQNVIANEWGNQLIRSWNQGWYERSKEIAGKLAPLIGARPDEVIMADSTSVNLFKLGYAALRLQTGKKALVSDELNFPSDIYVLQGLIDLFGNKHELRLAKSPDGIGVTIEELEHRLSDDTALLSLSHVAFKSAFMYDMKAVTQMAHNKGAMVLWDLSHAAGAVPINLNACNADMAIGCTYKYLNGGPGSIAFLYVRKDLQERLYSPIWGWFGQNDPFSFSLDYKPAEGIQRFLAGTPPVLSLSAIEPALDMMHEAGIERLREKSLAQSRFLLKLHNHFLESLGFGLGSPEKDAERGSHISLRHHEACRICKALIDPDTGGKTVIPDFREPDNIRLGITPLYTSYMDIYEAVIQIKMIAEQKLYNRFSLQREKVT